MSTVLITGANRGIGLALARLHAERGDTVLAVCRNGNPELASCDVEVLDGIDVRDDAALASLAKQLDGRPIDRMILNAGILRRQALGSIDAQGFEAMREQYEVNALGPLRVVQALLPNLGDGSRIGIVTSRMGSMADNGSGGHYGYRASKAAVNAIGRSLAMDLKPRGIAVFLLHPGFVSTDMVGGQGEVSPEFAAAGLAARMDELDIDRSGSFWHANGSELPW